MAVMIYFIIFALSMVHSSKSAVPQFCPSNTMPTQSGPKLPKIPDTFVTTVEKASLASRGTVDFSAYVNWQARKISVINHVKGGDLQEIYDYNLGQKTSIGQNDGFCKVTKDMFGPIGFSPLGKDTGSIEDLFFFGKKYNLTYNKVSPFRGLSCNTWIGCVNSKDVSLFTSFCFSTNITVSGSKQPVLLAYSVSGHVASGNSYKNVSLMYNFFGTHPGPPPPEKMQLPKGVYCPESKHSCQFPKIPFEFEMNAEMIGGRTPGTFNSREYVDSKEKYHRSDHHHRNKDGVRVPIHEIHDYNTGISYTIDSTTLKCSMEPISMSSWDSVETADHHHIRMKTSTEFFGLNVNQYSCKGNTTVRGIPAEFMASPKNGTRMNPNETFIQEWYFSRPGWKISGKEGPSDTTRVPLKQVWYHANRTALFTINYFNFDPVETTTHILWILRYCYINNRHYMYFRLNSPFDKYGIVDQKFITSGLRDAVAKIAGISKLRVSSILIFKSGYGGVIAIRLYVLGLPAIKGSVSVLDPKHEIPLKDAVKKIKTAISSGKLTVTVNVKGKGSPNVVTMKAQAHSYYDNTMDGPDPVPNGKGSQSKASKAGVTSGAAAGIAIALFILAIVLTVVAMNFFLKRRGVQLFQYARYNNEAPA